MKNSLHHKNPESCLYTVQENRELEQIAADKFGIIGFELMNEAGRACFNIVQKEYSKSKNILIFCGKGNNAGDGYIVASIAKQSGYHVQVVYLVPPSKLKGDALKAYQQAQQNDVPCISFSEFQANSTLQLRECGIIDAILGTGFRGKIKGQYLEAIHWINASNHYILSIDTPSGVCCDTGLVLTEAIVATSTVMLLSKKKGLYTSNAVDHVGNIYFDNLKVPHLIYEDIKASTFLLQKSSIQSYLKPRKKNIHKGNLGHVLVLGGDYGMAGAVTMASEAAIRIGAGLVSVVTRKEHISSIICRRPEIMVHAVENESQLSPLLDKATVFVLGPGLGKSEWSKMIFKNIIKTKKPTVFDADALNLIAENSDTFLFHRKNTTCIFTPHVGEAKRLLHINTSRFNTSEINTAKTQLNRFESLHQLIEKYQGTFVLKGAGSLIASSNNLEQYVCPVGNPGMASAGMGDILSGMIGGLLAQGLNEFEGVKAGVWIHSFAADLAIEEFGERSLVATDLLVYIQTILRSM